jgi:hypothetical protein
MAGRPTVGRWAGGGGEWERARCARYDGRVRPYVTPRCLGMHAALLVLLPLFAWLTLWQLHRAQGGNSLSWAYVFLWPAFGIYAVYTWWNLVHDQVEGSRGPGPSARPAEGGADDTVEAAATSRPPGWALTGGRRKNVAIAGAAPIDAERGGRGERFTAQTPEEAARLAEYNRYLAALNAEDAEDAESGSRSR